MTDLRGAHSVPRCKTFEYLQSEFPIFRKGTHFTSRIQENEHFYTPPTYRIYIKSKIVSKMYTHALSFFPYMSTCVSCAIFHHGSRDDPYPVGIDVMRKWKANTSRHKHQTDIHRIKKMRIRRHKNYYSTTSSQKEQHMRTQKKEEEQKRQEQTASLTDSTKQ